MKTILLGYMGSGKTTIGKKLSVAVNQPFIDLDTQIEQLEKKSIIGIFQSKGEIYFRKREREVLENLLSQEDNIILSLGGGTPCLGDTMEMLVANPDVNTIYLKASNEVLTNRLFVNKEERPLISHIPTKSDLNDFVRKHLFERNFYYNQASQKISIDDKDEKSIVAEIVAKLY